MNEGEKSEIYLKAFLLRMRDRADDGTLFGRIWELADDADLSSLKWDDDWNDYLEGYDIASLVDSLGIGKAGTLSKADVKVNRVSYSIKEKNSNPSAVVNHTPRPGFETACNAVHASIDTLDRIIAEYWKLRNEGTIKQDTKVSDPDCPFRHHKEYLRPIIEYFMFTGTGRGISNFPADKILEISYKSLPEEMEVFEKDDYFDQIWERLVFSVRSKGMSSRYPDCRNFQSISKWTNSVDGRYKGSLHIRILGRIRP